MEPRGSTSDVTILIPYRSDSPHRTAIRTWQYGYLNSTYPHVPVIVADDGLDGGPFNRSTALNRARAKATTEWLWVLDTDTAPHPDDLGIALAAPHDGWIYPYQEVLELDEVGTRFTLDGRCGNPHDWNAHTRKSPTYGLPLLHADVWDDADGWDENYIGWGYEDLAFRDALLRTHPPEPASPIRWIRTLRHPRDYPSRPSMLNAARYNASIGR